MRISNQRGMYFIRHSILGIGMSLVIFAFLAAGCDRGEPVNPAPDIREYFPTSVRSLWYYEGQGNEYATFSREVLYQEGTRAQFKEDNGGTVTATVYETSGDAITRIFFKGEEYEGTNFLGEESTESLVILKTPLEVGTRWDTEYGSREIVEINATTDTPAGSFDSCILVEIKEGQDDSMLYEYFAPGVGMIKREFVLGDDKVTSSLSRYTIEDKQ